MLLSAKDAAKYMDMTPATIRRWCRQGKITLHQMPERKNGILVSTEELDAFKPCNQCIEPDTIHGRIHYLRIRSGKSAEATAAEAGIDKETYRLYEGHKKAIPVTAIIKLALYHEVPTDYLLCMDTYEDYTGEEDLRDIVHAQIPGRKSK